LFIPKTKQNKTQKPLAPRALVVSGKWSQVSNEGERRGYVTIFTTLETTMLLRKGETRHDGVRNKTKKGTILC
jgi:hypothetical protein